MFDLVIMFLSPFFLLPYLISQYKIVQSQHYEMRKSLKYSIKKKTFIQVFALAVFFVSFFFNRFDKFILTFALIVVMNLVIEGGNLRFTNRVKRFFIVYFFVTYLLFLVPIDKVLLLMVFAVFFNAYILMIHGFSCFIEKIIMSFYIRDAQKIIKDIKVIGITGSYGKTSCKNIIYDMISEMFNVSKTPKSFNNKVGIVKSVRECVSSSDDYFICEYGVDKKGGMNKLLKIVKPNISLITEVGPQHLLTFKSIENIVNEKIKIAKMLNEDEYVVINNDNEFLKEEIKKLKCKIITYGIKNNSGVMAKNIVMTNEGTTFDLYIDDKKYMKLKITLLGEHNVSNVLGAIGVLKAMGVDLQKLRFLTTLIKPVEHRLELKILDGVKVIDDGFNSNEVGFKKAIDVLGLMEEEKWVITPGIIEQGSNSRKVNYELGKYMAGKVDFVILVEENSAVIKEGLLDNNFNEKNIIIMERFHDAWVYIKKINESNKIFLIENDLPNIYLK